MKVISKILLTIALPFFILESSATSNRDFFKGIDVSVYQGEINFGELSNSGIDYLYIRAGEGGNITDSRFEENYKGAEAEQLYYGFYYYVTAKNSSEAEIQAEHFANLITNIPYSLRPAMDFEDFTDISQEESNGIALSFLKKLESLTGVTPTIYTDAYCVETRWSQELSPYPLWVADYGHLAEPQEFILPENSVWSQWSGYQYTDSSVISGISAQVDGDLFTSDLLISKNQQNTSQGTFPSTTEVSLSYQVKSGDTLWKLSELFDSSVEALAEKNNISNVNLIYVNEVLEIPMKLEYTIERGDTLTEIALKYDTTVDILTNINGIKDKNLIFVGELLYIP